MSGSAELPRIDYWSPFSGIDLVSPSPGVSIQHARDCSNFRIDDSGFLLVSPALQQGSSTDALGKANSVYTVPDTDGTYFLICSTHNRFQIKTHNGAWEALSGPLLPTTYATDRFNFTRWSKYIIASNESAGLYKIDPQAKTYSEITAITEPPMHVTALGNRVILTRMLNFPGRIQWSVKGNSDDYTSLGSGIEDLTNASGGNFDRPWSTWPISANEAIVVCERGLFLMSSTDNFDLPFRFTRIPGEGTPCPWSVVAVPGGVIYAGWTDFWFATRSGAQSIGRPWVSHRLFTHPGDLESPLFTACGVYVRMLDEYWLDWSGKRLVYNRGRKGWTRGVGTTGHLSYIEGLVSTPYDSLVGTIDAQVGPMDELGTQSGLRNWRVFVADYNTRVDFIEGGTTAANVSVATGDIELEKPDNRISISSVGVVYDHKDQVSRTVIVDKSVDGGAWQELGRFDTKPYSPTDPDQSIHITTLQGPIEGHYARLRVRSDAPPERFRLIRLSVYASQGASSYQA